MIQSNNSAGLFDPSEQNALPHRLKPNPLDISSLEFFNPELLNLGVINLDGHQF